MNAKPFVLVPLVTALVACGGSGTDSSTSSNLGSTVSVLITDNLTQTYSEVWVEVRSISAIDANGQKVVLFEDTTGQTYNLSQLVNVGALVDAQTVTPGTYTSFEIVLGNQITLVRADTGAVINATFDQTGNPTHTVTVGGNLVVDPNQPATLALDFDLANFTYDDVTKTVTPSVIQKDPNELAQATATTQGQVQAVNGPDQFVVAPATGGADITVNLHNNATVTDPAAGTVAPDTTGLQPGMNVNVSGTYDANTLTVTAANVQVDRPTAPVALRHEVEGIVVSVNGAVIEIDVKEASFRPDGNTLTIDVGNALFSKGSLTMLAAGQEVEIKGDWDGTGFTAGVVEIEGAPRNTSSRSYDDDYAEIEGWVTAVAADSVTLTVREYEHVSGIRVGDVLTIDRSGAWYKHGDAACLAPNMEIEVKGAFTATTMEAFVIEYDDDSCYGAYGDDDHDDDYDDDHEDDDDHDEDDD